MRLTAAVALVVVMSGCAPRVDQETAAKALQPLYCQSDSQCARYWQAAQAWVARNSPYPLQVVTDSVIQTAQPRLNDVDLAFIVTKEKISNAESITISGRCANMFGCQPDPAVAVAAFKEYVRNSDR